MSDKYLNKLESDLTSLLDKTVSTYESLEAKARYIAAAFIALLASIMGYVLQSFGKIDVWQQAFIVGLLPCFTLCFLSLVSAMMARKYRDGIRYPFQEGLSNEKYLRSRCAELNKAILINQDSNIKKGHAINKAFFALCIAAPAAILSSGCAAFYTVYRDRFGLDNLDNFFLLGLLAFIAVISVISVGHFSALISGDRQDTSNED